MSSMLREQLEVFSGLQIEQRERIYELENKILLKSQVLESMHRTTESLKSETTDTLQKFKEMEVACKDMDHEKDALLKENKNLKESLNETQMAMKETALNLKLYFESADTRKW